MQDVFPNERGLWQKLGTLWLDVRGHEKSAATQIPGFSSLPLRVLFEQLSNLCGPLITIWASGSLAGLAAKLTPYEGLEAGRRTREVQGYAVLAYPLVKSLQAGRLEETTCC
jgi:hypothetical protein